MTHTLRLGTGSRVLALDSRLANALLDRTMVHQESVDDPFGRRGAIVPGGNTVETPNRTPLGINPFGIQPASVNSKWLGLVGHGFTVTYARRMDQ